MMRTVLNKIIVTIQHPQFIKAAVCFTFIVFAMLPHLHAQAITDPGAEPDPSTPIDGGLSLLVAAGVVHGAKKLKERKANKLENSKG